MVLRKLINLILITCLTLTILLTSCSVEPDEPVIPDQEGIYVGGGEVDISIPSDDGELAVRLYLPETTRYSEGAPVIIQIQGGYEEKDLSTDFRDNEDMLIVTFLFHGVESNNGLKSDGTYDYRGEDSAAALRDVILFASGDLADTNGKLISELAGFPVLTNNVGAIGTSNGGNLPVATAALYGEEIADDLKYVIQWETPVSSQIACRDLGNIILEPLELTNDPSRGRYFNPRYQGFSEKEVLVDHSDVMYDENSIYQVFYDGNGDGVYSSVPRDEDGKPDPDLNGDEELSTDEDFPLDYYPGIDKAYYSRPVTHALLDEGVLTLNNWPSHIATPDEADAYWDIRESVYLYEEAMDNIPGLEAMFQASQTDHVQSNPYKSHIRMAFEGWLTNGAWIKINPSAEYLVELDQSLAKYDLPDLAANTPPVDWSITKEYTIPEMVNDQTYQIAGIHEMADRVYYGS